MLASSELLLKCSVHSTCSFTTVIFLELFSKKVQPNGLKTHFTSQTKFKLKRPSFQLNGKKCLAYPSTEDPHTEQVTVFYSE